MTTSQAHETALQKELRFFREGFARLGNTLFNKLFDLTPESAARRLLWLVIFFFASGFLLSLINYPINLWTQHFQDIFLYLFNAAYRSTYVGDPLTNFGLFLLQVILDPRNLRFLPLLLAPFFISLQSAAIYVADVFNLEDVSIARSHVNEVALTGSDDTIRISKGEILEEHRYSPNYLIGGPGKVIVDFDSAALFEKPDGTPHVIGPTGKLPGGKATLVGFERFRESIDIRDQFIDLRDQNEKSPTVKSRSKDGIPIIATDVRLMFSIHRDEKSPSEDFPYPFSERAIENIVYKATSQVTPDLPNPSTYRFSWIGNMLSLVRGELGGFMNQHNLTEYIASTGLPEVEKAIQREEAIQRQTRNLIPTNDALPESQGISPAPDFTPRHKITSLFSKFAQKFTANARARGVELQWIGVGTWKTPIENVVENHVDAWKLNLENQSMGSEEAMNEFEADITLNKMASLIKGVPILAYRKITGSAKQSSEPVKKDNNNGEDDIILEQESIDMIQKFMGYTTLKREKTTAASHQDAMKSLLIEYRKLLIEAAEFIEAKNEIAPSSITDAIEQLEVAMKLGHWVGKNKKSR